MVGWVTYSPPRAIVGNLSAQEIFSRAGWDVASGARCGGILVGGQGAGRLERSQRIGENHLPPPYCWHFESRWRFDSIERSRSDISVGTGTRSAAGRHVGLHFSDVQSAAGVYLSGECSVGYFFLSGIRPQARGRITSVSRAE